MLGVTISRAPQADTKPEVEGPKSEVESRKPKSASPISYVCPMCPEVRETKPGACPSCGMALEPDMPIAATRTEYTCPMHPEIVRARAGIVPDLRHGA